MHADKTYTYIPAKNFTGTHPSRYVMCPPGMLSVIMIWPDRKMFAVTQWSTIH